MFILPTDIRDLGISKIMKISLPNLNDMDFKSEESTEKISQPTDLNGAVL